MTGAGGFTGVGAIAPIEKPLLMPSPATQSRKKKKPVAQAEGLHTRQQAELVVRYLIGPKNSC